MEAVRAFRRRAASQAPAPATPVPPAVQQLLVVQRSAGNHATTTIFQGEQHQDETDFKVSGRALDKIEGDADNQ